MNLSILIRLLIGLASLIGVSVGAFSHEVQPESPNSSSERTHPKYDLKHPWHLDLPSKWLNRGQSGTCLVRFQVDPDGGIRVAQVVRSTGFPELDLACVQNILNQTLLPATDHGVPITEWVAWPISMNAKTPPAAELQNTSGVPQIQQYFSLRPKLSDYPDIDRAVRSHKDCSMRLWVTPEATVEKTEVTQSTGIEKLDQACRSAVLAAPFTPARQEGAAVGAWVEITMRWNKP